MCQSGHVAVSYIWVWILPSSLTAGPMLDLYSSRLCLLWWPGMYVSCDVWTGIWTCVHLYTIQRLIGNVENCHFQSTGDAFTQIFNTTIWLGCLLFRAANVFPCAHLVNMLRPVHKQIPINHQKALWFSGKLFIHAAGNSLVGFKTFWQILCAAQASGNECSSLIVSLKCFWLLLVSKLLQ